MNHDKNHYALILGASSGMGLATAHQLARDGMNLCLVHRDRRSSMAAIEEEFQRMGQTGADVLSFNLNALQSEKRAQVIEGLSEHLEQRGGKLRLVLHAISRGNLKRLAPSVERPEADLNPRLRQALDRLYPQSMSPEESQLSEEDFGLTLHAMATSLWGWVYELRQADVFAEDARILALTSEGNQRVWPYYAAVSTAKVALEAIIRAMAVELAPYGLRSNVIQAGITDTPSLRMIPGSEELKASAIYRNPFGRLTTPEDVAKVVSLLCTDQAAWINGALIPVDGGERLG